MRVTHHRRERSELRGALPQISLAPSAAARGTGLVPGPCPCMKHVSCPCRSQPDAHAAMRGCPPPRGSPASRHLRPARPRGARARAGRAANCADTMRIPRGGNPNRENRNPPNSEKEYTVPRYRCILQKFAVQYRLRLVPPGVSKSNPRRRDRHHRPPSPTPTHCPTLRSCHSKRTPSG